MALVGQEAGGGLTNCRLIPERVWRPFNCVPPVHSAAFIPYHPVEGGSRLLTAAILARVCAEAPSWRAPSMRVCM